MERGVFSFCSIFCIIVLLEYNEESLLDIYVVVDLKYVVLDLGLLKNIFDV